MINLDLDEKDDKEFIDEITELISLVIKYFNPYLIKICKIQHKVWSAKDLWWIVSTIEHFGIKTPAVAGR